MKEVKNIDAFFEKIKDLTEAMGKSSSVLFQEICDDLQESHDHIMQQQTMLTEQFDVFKASVYKL